MRAWTVAGFVFLYLFIMAGTVLPATCLEMTGGEPERVVLSLPVEDKTVIQLEFINSIYLAPVRETLIYESGRGISIIMVESPSAGVFEYYGLETDNTHKANLYRHVGSIRLRSHDYRHHTLTVGGKVIRLKGLVEDGEPLTVNIRSSENCVPGLTRGR